jgi:4-carboxymuconolactone decarboxylase
MSRIPLLNPQDLSASQRAVYDAIVASPRGGVPGPLGVWLTSPDLAQRAQELGAFCRYGTSLSARLSELAILVTATHWRAGYEWFVHAPEAAKAGLDAEVIGDLQAGRAPRFQHADERAVYDFARELLDNHVVSKAAYAAAVAAVGETGVVELTGILGYYGLISMTIKAFEIAVPSGEAEPFAADAAAG